MVHSGHPIARGLAYTPFSGNLLINVPNAKMSAFDDQPNHFCEWLAKNGPIPLTDDSFAPRSVYGDYLSSTWTDALRAHQHRVNVEIISEAAVDIELHDRQAHVTLQNGRILRTNRIVLALGNGLPRRPGGIDAAWNESCGYFANPWSPAAVSNLPDHDILILGNGLSMADTAMALADQGFTRKMYTISPSGYRLQPLQDTKPPCLVNDVLSQLPSLPGLHALVVLLNRERKRADREKRSFFPVIDALRPFTPQLWTKFTPAEKSRFKQLLSRIWDRYRHRLPPQIVERMNQLLASGQLLVHQGEVTKIQPESGGFAVEAVMGRETRLFSVGRIINCTGPDSDPRTSHPLLARMLRKNLLQPGPLYHGIATDQHGAVLYADETVSTLVSAIGPLRKGMLLESTAVPELRGQATDLAARLIADPEFPIP